MAVGPCAKQVVTATIVTPVGERFVGTNYVRNHQPICPRADMPTGVGYHLCKEVCDQSGHAEPNAIAAAGEKAKGAVLYLEGHTYACDPCKEAADRAGIREIVIGSPPPSTEQKVLAVVAFQSGHDEVTRESKLHEDLELDSLDRIDLAVQLERTFNIDIPDEDVDRQELGVVGGLVDYIEARLAE